MTDAVMSLLRVHEYFRGIPDETLQEIVSSARITRYAMTEVVHEATSVPNTVGFVLTGRLKAVRIDSRGHESLFRMIERGDQYGMMVGALSEPVPIRVVALEPSMVLELDFELAMDLTYRHKDLRRLWMKTFAGTLQKYFLGSSARRGPMMLALIHETSATRRAAERLVNRLRELGEQLAVLSDSESWREVPGVRFRALRVEGQELDPTAIRQQVTEWQDASRVIFDVDASMPLEQVARMLEIVDRAVYFVPSNGWEAATHRLQALQVPARGWRDKLSIAWLLGGGGPPLAPVAPNLREFALRDFKIGEGTPQAPYGPGLNNGLERLVHDLRGVRIGVALGGGAARGMSHIGVLKALERTGIVVDMVAGTSAGAMTGVLHASGLDADYVANQFAADLRPSWFFRCLPHGNHWFLLYKYRRGQFDPMLRKYLHNWKLEQLMMPCYTVTVDLVSGSSVVRERGDAVHAILESINLPVLSVPICREGQALIDGGLVNNIPADVLVSMGCNFVIAVSVTAKLEKQFCDMRSDVTTPPRKKPTIIQTLFRSLLVQSHSLNSFGVQPADVVIEPDLTSFDLTEFMKARALAEIGEAEALGQIPKIRHLLNRLDPQLFPITPAG